MMQHSTEYFLTSIAVQAFLDAVEHYNNETCIRFVPRTTEKHYLTIIDGVITLDGITYELG